MLVEILAQIKKEKPISTNISVSLIWNHFQIALIKRCEFPSVYKGIYKT